MAYGLTAFEVHQVNEFYDSWAAVGFNTPFNCAERSFSDFGEKLCKIGSAVAGPEDGGVFQQQYAMNFVLMLGSVVKALSQAAYYFKSKPSFKVESHFYDYTTNIDIKQFKAVLKNYDRAYIRIGALNHKHNNPICDLQEEIGNLIRSYYKITTETATATVFITATATIQTVTITSFY